VTVMSWAVTVMTAQAATVILIECDVDLVDVSQGPFSLVTNWFSMFEKALLQPWFHLWRAGLAKVPKWISRSQLFQFAPYLDVALRWLLNFDPGVSNGRLTAAPAWGEVGL